MSQVVEVKRRILRLRGVHTLRAGIDTALLLRTMSRSPLLDPVFYGRQRDRKPTGALLTCVHWLWRGETQGLVLGPLLLPTVSGAVGTGPLAIIRRAAVLRRARFPRTTSHPLIDLGWYLQQHPEAATYPGGPLVHWAKVGRAAGFPTHPKVIATVDLFTLGDLSEGQQISPHPPSAPFTSLVIVGPHWPLGGTTLRALYSEQSMVVVGYRDTVVGRLVSDALAQLPTVLVVESEAEGLRALAVGGPDAPGEIVLLATGQVEIGPGTTDALLLAVDSQQAAIGGPIVLARDGAVIEAGFDQVSGALVARGVGLSPDDVRREVTTRVAAVASDLIAVRRSALQEALLTRPDADIPQTLQQISDHHQVLLVTAAEVRRVTTAASNEPTAIAPRPAQVREQPPRLRWAVKSPHPPGNAGQSWGDLHFGRGLAEALERLGQFAVVDPLDSWDRRTADQDDVVVVLRGLHRYLPRSVPTTAERPAAKQTTVLWLISHPELVTDTELASMTLAYAASTSWSKAATERGVPVTSLLQCTDPTRFHPTAGPFGGGPTVLFVGNTRRARRPIVELAAKAGLPLKIVGGGWEARVEPAAILADHVDNADLPALYRSAGLVLNDHWSRMAQLGFLSNRLFDLTACGARWVSDPAADLVEVFGAVARTAANHVELAILAGAVPEAFADEATRLAASELVRKEHSFDARAARLLSDVLHARQRSAARD